MARWQPPGLASAAWSLVREEWKTHTRNSRQPLSTGVPSHREQRQNPNHTEAEKAGRQQSTVHSPRNRSKVQNMGPEADSFQDQAQTYSTDDLN